MLVIYHFMLLFLGQPHRQIMHIFCRIEILVIFATIKEKENSPSSTIWAGARKKPEDFAA